MSDSTTLDEILSQCNAETENADIDVSNLVNSIQKLLIDSDKILNTTADVILKKKTHNTGTYSLEQFL